MAQKARPTYVYCIGINEENGKFGDVLKIGIAYSPSARVKQCQTGSPLPLLLLKTWKFESEDAARSFEKACHREFVERRVRYEWFFLDVGTVDRFHKLYVAGVGFGGEIDDVINDIIDMRKKANVTYREVLHREEPVRRPEPVKPMPPAEPDHRSEEHKPTAVDADKKLGTDEAAAYISKSASWLHKTRMNGSGPVYLKIGGAVRYRVKDLDAWLDKTARVGVYDHCNKMPAHN